MIFADNNDNPFKRTIPLFVNGKSIFRNPDYKRELTVGQSEFGIFSPGDKIVH
jgi:hypothetical protein